MKIFFNRISLLGGWLYALLLGLGIPSCANEDAVESRRSKVCKASNLQLNATCMPDSIVSCDQYIYSPDLLHSGETVEQRCFVSDSGRKCIEIKNYQFSTEAQLGLEPEEFFRPGASLNFVESRCFARRETGEITAETKGGELEEALGAMLNLCQVR